MGTQYPKLEEAHQKFIKKQPIFFVGSAATTGMINVSPKGMDSLRILGPNRIVWRNLTGSGNETAAHVAESPRMTIMWCSFEGPPMIFRAFGTARAIHRLDADWAELDAHFEPNISSRQLFDMTVEMAQKSCGYAVPEMDYIGDRDVLTKWAETKGEAGVQDYWATRNTKTLDGVDTDIVARNLGR